MSDEQAKVFAEKAFKDPSILEKLSVDNADIVAIAKEHGHEFDEEHIKAAESHFDSLTDAMSDEELEDVAGGTGFTVGGNVSIGGNITIGGSGGVFRPANPFGGFG